MTYNGWTNYPTWAVSLWLMNTESLYHATLLLNRLHWRERDFADALKELVTSLLPDVNGLASDLLWYAVDEVNWDEIALTIREDYPLDGDEVEGREPVCF